MHLSGWAANYAPGKNFFAQPSPFSVAIDDTRYALLEASSGGEQVYISRTMLQVAAMFKLPLATQYGTGG